MNKAARLLCFVVSSVAILVVLSLILQASNALAQDSQWTGNINVLLGAKALNKNDWSPADQQGEIGIKFDIKQRSWPVSVAVDYLSASGNGTDMGAKLESTTSELNIGVRKIWDQFSLIRPFIGGGLSFASGEAKVTIPGVGSASDSGSGMGLWIGGGVYWTLGEHFNIGLELMSSSTKVTIAGVDTNVGGGHFGVLAGYHW